ncbi:MAG: S8 family serine peptidase [Chloroflexi bacterium]|nr:S8 family serine peptidase [Chloroflexota bacterium]
MFRRLVMAPIALALVFALLPATARSQTPATEVITDQFIVVLLPGASARTEAQAAEAAHGVQVRHVYEHALAGFAFKGPEQAARALASNPRVRFVGQDRAVQHADQPLPTGVDRIDADTNTTARIDGVDQRVDVNVAIVDTGVEAGHPDLNVAGGVDCTGLGWSNDGHGHGTHVAGTVGALDNGFGVVGVAPGVRLWAVRVLDDGGRGSWSNIICGVDWVTGTRTDGDPSNDIAVANLSLGGNGSDDGKCGTGNDDALHRAICGSVARGVVYVVAAGNSNKDAAAYVPAAYDEVLTVSAIADSDGRPGGLGPALFHGADDTLAKFSNYGRDVDIAAPGVEILSTYKGGGYARMSGTSMASPHVAGVAALYIADHGRAEDAAGVATIRQHVVDPARGYSVAQRDPKGFTRDKDGYAEPLAYVGPRYPHDVAVTAVTAPTWLLLGTSTSVTVRVSNQGTSAESFAVTLEDATAGVALGSQSVTLAAGASASLSFTWATSGATATGDHVLRATAAPVAGETSLADNNRSATITVKTAHHDVAVTGITPPAAVVQGNSAAVAVTAANDGTYPEAFAVTLRDATDGVVIGSQSVSLPAGGATTLSFTWATSGSTTLGTHTLTATASPVSDEADVADNSRSAAVTVKGTMHVADLDAASAKAPKGAWQEAVTIAVHDMAHRPLEGAVVAGTFYHDGSSRSVACTTGATGSCTVNSGTLTSPTPKGSFVVTNVAHPNWGYAPPANHDPDGDSDGTTIVFSK